MPDNAEIKKECVKPLLETKFIKVFDLQYEEGKHYFDATRRDINNLVATKSDEEFKVMPADAVTCVVIVKTKDKEPRLLTFYEYRYPTGRYLLSPPAGLMDPEDLSAEDPIVSTAKREIFEETGITVKDIDSVTVINPLAFSTPGMTDESNAFACAVINLDDENVLNNEGAVGSEKFDGFLLLTMEDARRILKAGRDDRGNFYSLSMWAVLLYFVSGLWK